MPKPRTLQRRAQRKRAAARQARSLDPRMQEFDALLKSIYTPAIRAMFERDNLLYRTLREEDVNAFAVGQPISIPLHRG